MFGFSKKKQPEPGADKHESGGPIIATLLLEGNSFPVDAFLKDVAKTRIAGKAASDIDPGKGGVFSFDVGDEFLALALMPAPYPASDLEGPIATSWMWPKNPPIQNLKKHRSHLLVTMTGGAADPLRPRRIVSAIN